jgi:hypothetical protein
VQNSTLSGIDRFGLYREWMELRMMSQMGNTSFGTTYMFNGMPVSAAAFGADPRSRQEWLGVCLRSQQWNWACNGRNTGELGNWAFGFQGSMTLDYGEGTIYKSTAYGWDFIPSTSSGMFAEGGWTLPTWEFAHTRVVWTLAAAQGRQNALAF